VVGGSQDLALPGKRWRWQPAADNIGLCLGLLVVLPARGGVGSKSWRWQQELVEPKVPKPPFGFLSHGLVFASVGPIIDIRLASTIGWLSSQVTRLSMPKTLHFFQSSCVLGTACLLGSPCILKPSCISRKALGISSPLAGHMGWLLQVAGHGTLFSSWLLASVLPAGSGGSSDSTLNQLHLLGHASTSRSFALACVGAISIVKSAANTAFSEVNVMEPFAFFRTVALAWTEGLNT
jgi:hypothetical protein